MLSCFLLNSKRTVVNIVYIPPKPLLIVCICIPSLLSIIACILTIRVIPSSLELLSGLFFQLKKPLTMREFTRSLKSATLRVELNCQGRDLRLCKPSCISFRTMGEGGTNSGSFANLQLSTLVAISADHCASKCYFSGTFPRKICFKEVSLHFLT